MSVLAVSVDDYLRHLGSPPKSLARLAVPVTVAVAISLAAMADLAASHTRSKQSSAPVPGPLASDIVTRPELPANLSATSRGPCRLGEDRAASNDAYGRRTLRRASPERRRAARHRRAADPFATLDSSMYYRLDISGGLADASGDVAAFDAMARPSGVLSRPAESVVLPKATTSVAASPLDLPWAYGRLAPAAQAGLLNGQPAAALGVRYSRGDSSIRIDAAGATEMTKVTDLSAMRKSFKVQTVASIPFD